VLVATACASAGATSLLDASSAAQHDLDAARAVFCHPGAACPGHWTVSGYGDVGVLILLGLALASLALTAFAIGQGRRVESVGGLSAGLAVLLVLALWLDTLFVAESPAGLDSVGVSGPASVAINRAGWLLCAAVALSIVLTAWMHLRTAGDTYSKPYEALN
jgi:hypothetical protein